MRARVRPSSVAILLPNWFRNSLSPNEVTPTAPLFVDAQFTRYKHPSTITLFFNIIRRLLLCGCLCLFLSLQHTTVILNQAPNQVYVLSCSSRLRTVTFCIVASIFLASRRLSSYVSTKAVFFLYGARVETYCGGLTETYCAETYVQLWL